MMLVLLTALGMSVMLQLDSARIAIALETDSAVIEAHYRIQGTPDSVRFVLIKQAGQQLGAFNVRGAARELDTLPGLYQLTIPPSWSDSIPVMLRHSVSGDLARVPIFVPSTPTEPGTVAVRIAVRGLSGDVRFADGFPRLLHGFDGEAAAVLDNVPSFVRLPPVEGSWSTNRLADVFVLLLVLFASVLWLARRRIRLAIRSTA